MYILYCYDEEIFRHEDKAECEKQRKDIEKYFDVDPSESGLHVEEDKK